MQRGSSWASEDDELEADPEAVAAGDDSEAEPAAGAAEPPADPEAGAAGDDLEAEPLQRTGGRRGGTAGGCGGQTCAAAGTRHSRGQCSASA